jgi:membrane protease YdiL (CAAX protease family)
MRVTIFSLMRKSSHQSSQYITPLRFFLLTFILSWLIWIPLTLSHFNLGPFKISEGLSSFVRLLGVLMPMVSALLLTTLYGGRPAIRSLLSRLKIWRVGWTWWIAVVLVFPALLIFAGILHNLFSSQPPISLLPITAAVLLANILFLTIASLGEEIGWRGVALPGLLQRYSPLTASAILGIVWATWHLPFWILIDTLSLYGAGYFVLNYIFIVPTTFYITWVFINSKGSLLLPVVLHLTFNIINVALFPVTSTTSSFAVFVGLQLVLLLIIILKLRKETCINYKNSIT